MKIVLAVVLLCASTLANAGFVSGAVGGAVAGAIVSSGNKPTVVAPKPEVVKMIPGTSILVCRVDTEGRCDYKNYATGKLPLEFAGLNGFSKVLSQSYSKCSISYSGYCIIMEVSK